MFSWYVQSSWHQIQIAQNIGCLHTTKISAFVLVLIVNVKQILMQMPRVLVDESNDFKPSDLETGSKCEQLFEKIHSGKMNINFVVR